MSAAVEVVEQAFAALASGKATMPPRTVFSAGKGEVFVMPAALEDGAVGAKWVTVFPGNSDKGLPTTAGTMLLADSETGIVEAVLDAGLLTAIRTGAAGAVGAKHLARRNARRVVLFGPGEQGLAQLQGLAEVRPIEHVTVVGRRPGSAEGFIDRHRNSLSFEVVSSDRPEMAVGQADIVITATTSATPVFDGKALQPGTHVTCVGAHLPDYREVDTETVTHARYFADDVAANLAEAGEILIPIADGAVTEDHIVGGIGEVINGTVPGRRSEGEITVFKAGGLAVQDLAVATEAVRRARERGLGTRIDLA
jgi:ornithine cyclodeaminase